jgi:hypothetical protein
MSGINIRQLMAEAQTPQRALLEQTRGLVSKWTPTGLLEGLDGEAQRHGMAVLLENQARQLIDESTTTNPSSAGIGIGTAGSGEQWAGVALPLVRKVFGEIAAKEFVSIQPMNLPSGLIFFMDFKYGGLASGAKPGRATSDSVFGITKTSSKGAMFPSASVVPQGGLYGDGKFGYSINDQELTIIGTALSGSTGTTAAGAGTPLDSASVNYNELITNPAAGTFATNLMAYQVSMSAFTRPDFEGIRAFVPGTGSVSAGFTALTGWLPEFTHISSSQGVDWVTFIADLGQALSSVVYHRQPTDSTRGDFEDTRSEVVDDAGTAQASLGIPQIDLELRSIPIVAKTRKLKAVWTPELAQDLNAYHSIDAEAELTAMLSEYISLEIDLEILDMLMINAQTTDFWSTTIGEVFTNGVFAASSTLAGQAWTNQTWFETLGQKIQKVSNKIHQLTMRGGANFLVCSPDVSTILETIPGFTVETDGDKMKYAAGVTQIGSFQNRYTVYKNPYMLTNVILLGYKGANFLETGAVYAPYVPLVMTPLVYDPDNFTPRRGVLTRYAKKIVRPEFYGKILVKGISLL